MAEGYRERDRERDRLIEVQGKAVDIAYVRGQVVEMLGDDDERVRRWDELAAKV